MTKLRILCAIVCVQLAGCATCHDLQYRAVQQVKTHNAWKCSGGTSPCHPADFKDGWKEGYYSVATGGCGKLPPVPPKRYWKAKYQTPCGRDQVATWYRGFQEGVVVAQATCVRSWNPVPTSCSAALPTQPCQQCAGPYHEPPTIHAVQDPAPQTAPYVPQAPQLVVPPAGVESVPAEAIEAEPAKQPALEAPEVEQLPSTPEAAPEVTSEQIPARKSIVLEKLPNIVDPEPYHESLYRIPPVSKTFEARQPEVEVATKQPLPPTQALAAVESINEQLEAAFVKYAPEQYQSPTPVPATPEQSVPAPKAVPVRITEVTSVKVRTETPKHEAPQEIVAGEQSSPAKTTLTISRPQKAREVVAIPRKATPFRLDTKGLRQDVTVAWKSLEEVTRQSQQVWLEAIRAAEEAKPIARRESIPAKTETQAPLAERPQTPIRWHGENNTTFRPASTERTKLVLKGHEPVERIVRNSPTQLKIVPRTLTNEPLREEIIVEKDHVKRNYRVSDRSSLRFR